MSAIDKQNPYWMCICGDESSDMQIMNLHAALGEGHGVYGFQGRDLSSVNTSNHQSLDEYAKWLYEMDDKLGATIVFELDTKRTKWTGMKLFYAKRYLRRVWWALSDLGTVIRGGDPS